MNLDKQVTVITDSQNKSFDSKVIEKPPTMTLNVAANEFIPAKDIQKTLANGQNAEDMIKEKSRLPSKIPRLTSNDTYFPRQGSELSIRELQEQNDNFPVELEQFPEERTAADVKLETIVSDDILPLLNNPQNQEDENKTDVFITKESNDICSTTGSFSSDPTMPLNESDISMEEYSKKVTDPSLHLIHTDPKVASTDVEVITTKQSGFSLKPQTSLTESNYDNQEVIVDDDGFERNFVRTIKL